MQLFADIWKEHRIHIYSLAKDAGVSSDVVYAMISYRPVSEAQALKVLTALNALTGRSYTFDDIDINIEEKGDGGT